MQHWSSYDKGWQVGLQTFESFCLFFPRSVLNVLVGAGMQTPCCVFWEPRES